MSCKETCFCTTVLLRFLDIILYNILYIGCSEFDYVIIINIMRDNAKMVDSEIV